LVLRPRATGTAAGRAAGSLYGDATATATTAPRAPAPTGLREARALQRLVGVDLARALAFGGMLLAHYARPLRPGEAGWLQAADNAADGRAAPLFAVVLGIGAGLLLARGASDGVFVRRGVLLLALGIAIWPIANDVYLILPHYGVLLLAVPLLRRLPTRALLVAAAIAFLVPSVVTATVDDHRLRASPQPQEYADLVDAGELAREILWTGGYPLVGWAGFALVGLWVARQDLTRRGTRRRLLVGGVVAAALQPAAAAWLRAFGPGGGPGDARGWSAFLDGTAHSNATAWYVCASGSAVAVVALCLACTSRPGAGWRKALRPLIHLGQMMLSFYLLHLLLGAHVVWPWREEQLPSLSTQVLVALLTFVACAVIADLWRRRFRRGPVEALLRAVSR
jgi:uncharacterized membrane protein YeiB